MNCSEMGGRRIRGVIASWAMGYGIKPSLKIVNLFEGHLRSNDYRN